MVIFYENDFEVFIDLDGDIYYYYELEINVLGMLWDFIFICFYCDGGQFVDVWDIKGL